jgi:hypothetical protein
VAAAVAFPIMKALNPALPGFEAVQDHWKIAAGQVANRVFAISTWVQVGCALLCVPGAWVAARSPRGVLAALRLVAMSAAAGALAYQAGVLGPRMRGNLDEFMAAARRADPAAHSHRAAFDADHPAASRTLGVMSLGLALGLAAWTLGEPRPRGAAP